LGASVSRQIYEIEEPGMFAPRSVSISTVSIRSYS
jgi:hypothetical protein